MKKLLIILLLAFISISTLFAQKDQEKEIFLEGEYFMLYEEFLDALPLYLQLIEKYPDNANLNYRLGLCYLNIQGEKVKAIPYLEKAINNLTNRYKEGDFREEEAPYDTYFYLASAFLSFFLAFRGFRIRLHVCLLLFPVVLVVFLDLFKQPFPVFLVISPIVFTPVSGHV